MDDEESTPRSADKPSPDRQGGFSPLTSLRLPTRRQSPPPSQTRACAWGSVQLPPPAPRGRAGEGVISLPAPPLRSSANNALDFTADPRIGRARCGSSLPHRERSCTLCGSATHPRAVGRPAPVAEPPLPGLIPSRPRAKRPRPGVIAPLSRVSGSGAERLSPAAPQTGPDAPSPCRPARFRPRAPQFPARPAPLPPREAHIRRSPAPLPRPAQRLLAGNIRESPGVLLRREAPRPASDRRWRPENHVVARTRAQRWWDALPKSRLSRPTIPGHLLMTVEDVVPMD